MVFGGWLKAVVDSDKKVVEVMITTAIFLNDFIFGSYVDRLSKTKDFPLVPNMHRIEEILWVRLSDCASSYEFQRQSSQL